ncbi:hypothetical protein DV738_g1120, partial [Chaetothyriales sp. CBS 135597]
MLTSIEPAAGTTAPNDSYQDSGELNAHLSEKFHGSRPHRQAPIAGSFIDAAKDLVVNYDIRKYVHEQEKITEEAEIGVWIGEPEIPGPSEITLSATDEVELSPNKVKGKWKDKQKYLRTHYALLREDAVSPLRDAVDRFRRDPEMYDDLNVSIYEKVYITGFTFGQLGVAARIRFSTARAQRHILWSSSKRLTSGTLVALFPANDKLHRTSIVAIVACRPLQGLVDIFPPEIDIFFSRPEDIQIDPHQEWIMVEARKGYYEASRHTLRALQKMSKEQFPLSEHICRLSPDIEPPAYLTQDPMMNLSPATLSGEVTETDVLANWPSAEGSRLDDSQWAALNQILTKSLAIIQGPPGTGKTYVSTVALEVLAKTLKEDEPPVIIAAQTNHALDQLLSHVAKFEPRYIRLGGRSTSVEIKKRALFEIRRTERLPLLPGALLGQALNNHMVQSKKIIELLKPLHESPNEPFSVQTLLEYDIISKKQADSLGSGAARWISADGYESDPVRLWLDRELVPFRVDYETTPRFGVEEDDEDLEFEQLREQEAENGVNDEEDWELIRGLWCCLEQKWTVPRPVESDLERAARELRTEQDLWKIEESLRGAVYSLMQSQLKAKILEKVRNEAILYDKNLKDLKIGKWERDAVYLKRARFIGMTTTGLSKYRPLISSLKPKIVLIEEAAEVLEAPVAVACMPSVEQLILVGDHLQLQGHCNEQDLEGEPYYLNVSLFERLVNNGVPYKTLLRQRRMDPTFRSLLSSLYPGLGDHESVVNRPVPTWGMGRIKSFFFTHSWSEYRDSQMSIFNQEEAKFVARFYRYLHQNGMPVEDITILTFYNGQRKQILKEIRQFPELKEVYNKVKTVDSYQGEENEIVILSLTRSTDDGKIGFLSSTNRACVALSRARNGFYIFGNGQSLYKAEHELWNQVIQKMHAARRMADKLPLFCQKHNKTIVLQYVDTWDQIDGGCDEKCGATLECEHACPLNCHPYGHDKVECKENCEAFSRAQVEAENNEATEASVLEMSSMRRSLPATDARYPMATSAWNRGPPGDLQQPPSNGRRSENAAWGSGSGPGNQNFHPSGSSTEHLPLQNRAHQRTDGYFGARTTGNQRFMARSQGFGDRLNETTAGRMRLRPEEDAAQRLAWDSYANGGAQRDDAQREQREQREQQEQRELLLSTPPFLPELLSAPATLLPTQIQPLNSQALNHSIPNRSAARRSRQTRRISAAEQFASEQWSIGRTFSYETGDDATTAQAVAPFQSPAPYPPYIDSPERDLTSPPPRYSSPAAPEMDYSPEGDNAEGAAPAPPPHRASPTRSLPRLAISSDQDSGLRIPTQTSTPSSSPHPTDRDYLSGTLTPHLLDRGSYASNTHLAGAAATPGATTPIYDALPARSDLSIPLGEFPSGQSMAFPDSPYHHHRSSQYFSPAVSDAHINPNNIVDDGDDGFMPEPQRRSGNRPNAALHADLPQQEKSEWLNRQKQGRHQMRWVVGMAIGAVVVIAIVAGIVGGVLGSRKSSSSSGSSGSSGSGGDGPVAGSTNNAETDLKENGDLDINSKEIQALMDNDELHKVFPAIDYTPWGTQYPLCHTYPPSPNNVTRDMAVLSQLTNTVRLYGTDCNQTEMVMHSIKQLQLTDMKIWLGVWVDTNQTTTERQIAKLYEILEANKNDLSIFKGVIIGNEALYRAGEDKAQSEEELIEYLTDARSKFKSNGYDLPIATSDLGDNWNAQLVQAVDVVMSNIHPFFAGVTAEVAAAWTWTFWQEHDVVLTQGNSDIKQIISETGWPSGGGTDCGGTTGECASGQTGAVANVTNMNIFMDTWVCQALENGTDYFWFEAFDEPWKVVYNKDDQNWEDKWGLMDPARNLKSGLKIPDCGGKTVSCETLGRVDAEVESDFAPLGGDQKKITQKYHTV